ncbi:unnamed protein product [Phaedon cochleariae]|uniref:CDAN1-interacting nuclease 1 n=1 Tax=Phaedon cochleariae TaxID=80249 RepID=A0A9N9SJ52_PHACE|nr:unnamed protein product [Phaedon cochleariae]
MDAVVYKNIVASIKEYQGLSQNCMKLLLKTYPNQSYDTLYSILALEIRNRMKINHPRSQMNQQKFWEIYQKSIENCDKLGTIVRMAEKFDTSPCLLAKVILNQYFEKEHCCEDVPLSNINIYLRDTTLIPDMHLAAEVFLCTLYDNIYSPLTESMRSSLGQQYEIKLYKEVMNLGLGFRDEEHLRKHGYDKTPDCKLDVPIIIDGFVVNWIESKALFGDEDIHRDYMKNQYLSYWNRFGSGMILYWFGYLKTILEPNDKRFIIKDHLPKNIIQISPPNFELDDM